MFDGVNKPDIVIFGVVHSGTSLLTRMLFSLGWERNDADQVFCENVSAREINEAYRIGGSATDLIENGVALVKRLRRPFAVKDPRFVFQLPLWAEVMKQAGRQPVLLMIERDREALAKSYSDRGKLLQDEPGLYGRSLDDLLAAANEHYKAWPFVKMTIRYEDLVDAASLVRSEGTRRREGGLWVETPLKGRM